MRNAILVALLTFLGVGQAFPQQPGELFKQTSPERQHSLVENSLVTKGANEDARLLEASQFDDLTGALRALKAGAQVDARDKDGWWPLKWAAYGGFPEMAKLLLEKGADVNARDDGGWCCLHTSAEMGHLDIAQILLDRGADVNAPNQSGLTPLMSAISTSRSQIANLMIEKQADLEAKTQNGWTPLICAAALGAAGNRPLAPEERSKSEKSG